MVRGTLQWAEIDSLLLPSTLLIPNVGSGTHRPVRHERIQTVCYLSCNSTASYSSWSYSCGQRKPSAAEAVNTKQMLTAMSRSVRRRGPGRTRTRARAGRRSCDEAPTKPKLRAGDQDPDETQAQGRRVRERTAPPLGCGRGGGGGWTRCRRACTTPVCSRTDFRY